MDVSNFWWQSAGDGPGPGPDPGDPIGESLRFRGVATSLTRDVGVFAQGTYTYSFWVKISQSKRSGLFSFGNHWGTSSTGPTLDWNPDGSIQIFNVDASNANVLDGLYRDPSAWYHFVYVNETGVGTRVFVNGHQRYTSTTVTATSSNTLWAIGDNANIGVTGSRLDGYLAQSYFIDGQALEPTAFGRYNTEGVWVPDDYDGTYGTNGFHLDFADPDDLGADRSGNGNDFTATGFNTQLPGVWSQQLFTSTKSAIDFTSTNTAFAGGAGPQYAFDGVDNFATNPAATSDTSLIFRPNVPFTNVTEIRVNNGGPTGNTGNENGFNGANVTPVAADGRWMTLYSGSPITVDNIFTQSDNRCFIGGISINGQVLVDNPGTDYDLMQDSPTQNYATGNPLYFTVGADPSVITWSKANLAYTSSSPGLYQGHASQSIKATDTNTYYLEFSSTAASGGYPGVLVTQPGANPWNVNGLSWSAQSGAVTYNTVAQASWTGATYSANDTAGFTYNASTGVVTGFINGVQAGTFTMDTGIDRVFGFMAPPQNIPIIDFNFGQRPFIHQPEGTVALQTQNLPEAPITDGRDHFQAITGPGQGADLNDPGAGNWSQDLTITIGTQVASEPLTRCFNGNTGNTGSCNAVGGLAVMTFAPDPAITGVTSIEIWRAGGTNYEAVYNGVTSNLPIESGPAPWNPVDLNGGTEISATTPLVLRRTNGSALAIAAIRVNGNILIDLGILAQAQNTFPEGLWWIKDRVNSNQHQLVSSINDTDETITTPQIADASNYDPPDGNSVAWCWNCPDVFTPTCSETLVEARRNAAAGFSMVRLTTASNDPPTAETFEHGLNAPPALVMTQRFLPGGGNSFIRVWSDQLAAGQAMWLNSDDPAGSEDNTVATSTTNTVVNYLSMGDNPVPNGDLIFFNFAPVPGYSAFGSYTGNGSADGPFIYTGFRPAFVLTKRTESDTGGNWVILDSARNIANPTNLRLFPSTTGPESTDDVDFLSNGFKLRHANGTMNQPSGNYIYAAFAENPMGGSNVSPANAR